MSDFIPESMKSYVLNQINTIGESGLYLLDKQSFELYLVALEIRDEDQLYDPVIERLLFPVNPDSLMYIRKTLTNVKKSMTGVHVNDNDTFVPSPINLNGTFGKKYRFVVGKTIEFFTGYRTVKRLKEIVDLSKSVNSNGKPYRTVFYCLPFSEVFTVEINEVRFNMSVDKNRLWYYDLNMTAVAPGYIGGLASYYDSIELVAMNALNKFLNDTYDLGKELIWEKVQSK